ncbi:MAG: hypothetical protein ABL958_05350 [Bdellovibrionia bacterium]
MKFPIFLTVFFAVQISLADHHAPHLPKDTNICSHELVDEVTRGGRIEVIKQLIAQTPKKHPNCVDSHQGHSMLSYLADSYNNTTMLQVLQQLKPIVDFQNIITLSVLVPNTVALKGDTALMSAANNRYIASDTMLFYLLAYGANPNIQEDVVGSTALIEASDEGWHFHPIDPKGKYGSSTEYRKIMMLRLFGASPNIQGWTHNIAPYKGSYADTVFHRLARNRTGVEILEPFKLLIEPEKYLTYEHFYAQIPKIYTHQYVQISREQFAALHARMVKFDPRVLCVRNGAGRTVFDELKVTPPNWNKQPVVEYLSRYITCR